MNLMIEYGMDEEYYDEFLQVKHMKEDRSTYSHLAARLALLHFIEMLDQ